MSQEIKNIVENSETFRGISQEALNIVVSDPEVTAVTLKQGAYLYHAGDQADGFWLIESGRLLSQTGELREAYRPIGYNLGHVTGLNGLLAPEIARQHSMMADNDTHLVKVSSKVVRSLPPQDLAIVMENVAKILLSKLKKCRTFQDVS